MSHASDSFVQDSSQLEAFFGGDVEDNLVLEPRNDGGGGGVCSLRTCLQYVAGRNLAYAKALQIIQSEQYLDAVDPAAVGIRRMFRKKSGNRLRIVKRRRGRWKRQL